MSADKLVDKALKRIGNVHPVIAQGAEEIIRRAYKQGLYVLFSDGYRSNAEQDKLYAQGRTASGSIVTNARGGQSLHNYGLALDMFITNEDGTSAEWHYSGLKKAADIAKKIGFEWGGDWKSFKDYPHIQMTGGLSLAQLQAGQKPNIKLKGDTNVPAASKPVTQPGTSAPNNQSKPKGRAYIRKIQAKVNSPVDGIPGPDTFKKTVMLYQRALNSQFNAGLIVDGIPGPKTYAAGVTVREGASGDITFCLQAFLCLKGVKYETNPDSIFGTDTGDKTLLFQKDTFNSKKDYDGIPGKKTFKQLLA